MTTTTLEMLKRPSTVDEMLDCVAWAMLADVIWREARGEPFEGMVGVAEVVMARAADPRWEFDGIVEDDDYDEAILQPWQFSAYNADDPNVHRRPRRADKVFQKCCLAAVVALQGANFTGGANHYLNPDATRAMRPNRDLPEWYDEAKVTARIGRHVFLKV